MILNFLGRRFLKTISTNCSPGPSSQSSPARMRCLRRSEIASFKTTRLEEGSQSICPLLLERPPCKVWLLVCRPTRRHTNSIKEAVLELIHMTHPGSWGMISLSQYAWWPYMHREILAKTSDCVPCTDIGKNLKPIIPKSK